MHDTYHDANKSRIRGLGLYLLIASAMLMLLGIHYLMLAKGFAFTDIGVDTFFCFYPLQVAVSRELHALHSITWSFDLNLGGYIGSVFDPLLLLTGWLPESWQLGSRLPMFAFRVITAGGFFYGYLRLIRFDSRMAILGALGYAFSSYGLINAQWEPMHGTEFVQFAIFLFLFETYLAAQRRWVPVTAGIVIGLGHPMGLYMFGLFGLIYALARLTAIVPGKRGNHTKHTLAFAAWSIPGLLITAPLLFPAIHYLFESPRVSGNYSLLHDMFSQIFRINDRTTLASEIAGLVGKDLLGSDLHYVGWNNYFEGPGFYVGLLPLLCILQLLGPAATRIERRLCIVGLIGIALYFVFPALRTAVYGFGEPTFRFSTLWISALLLVLGLAGLRRIIVSGTWWPGLVIGGAFVLTIPITALVMLPTKVGIEHIIRIVAFVSVYLAILTMRSTFAAPSRLANFLLPIVACELLIFAIPPVVERDAVTLDASSPSGSYHDGTDQALAYVRQYQPQFSGNDDFYRIDKTYSSVFLDDALVQNYPGTASYFFHASSITRFIDGAGLPRPSTSPNYIASVAASGRRDMLDLLGVRYVLARDRSLDSARDMTFVSAVGNINVYRNVSAHAFGYFFDSVTSEAQANTTPAPQRDTFLLQHLVVTDPATVTTRLAALHDSSPMQGMEQSTHIRKIRDDLLTGTVQTPVTSTLLLSMPFDRGWTLEVDGKRTDTFVADYGLTAAVIAPGKHEVILSYEPPGRAIGKWLSLASLVFLAIPVLRRRLKRTTA